MPLEKTFHDYYKRVIYRIISQHTGRLLVFIIILIVFTSHSTNKIKSF